MSSSPSSPVRKRAKWGSEEVCVAVSFGSFVYIYTVDVKEKEKDDVVILRKPWIKLGYDVPDLMAFAVVDSTLYMFGGGVAVAELGWEVKSYSLDLSSYSSSSSSSSSETYSIDFSEFSMDESNRIPSMKSEKVVPAAAVLTNGLICVFSLYQNPGTSKNFEMYDPCAQTWSSVPDLPIDDVVVNFYCVENSFLYISTFKGSYRIDFSQPIEHREWKPCNIPTESVSHAFQSTHYLKDGDLLCSSHFGFCDLTAGEMSWKSVYESPSVMAPYLFPFEKDLLDEIMDKDADMDKYVFPPFQLGYFVGRERSILRLGNKDEERMRACIVETGWNEPCYHPLLRVTELKFYGLKPTVLYSRLFVCHGARRSHRHYILGVFQM